MKLTELARALEADLTQDTGVEIVGVNAHGAASPGTLVFCEDERTLASALASDASAVLVPQRLALQARLETASTAKPLLRVRHAKLAFARAAALLAPVKARTGVHPSAQIAASATLSPSVSVEAFAVIGENARIGERTRIGAGAVLGAGVTLGADCRIYPRVVLYPGTVLGDRVVLHAGAVIGADGFGYVRDPATGSYLQFPQQGSLVLEDDVEVGANATIDRGALAETRIGRGTKIDNLVHLGHNVEVGADVVIAAQTGVSGSSTIGDGAIIGGQVGLGDHAHVGPGVIVGSRGGVLPHKHLEGPGQAFWGVPAKPLKQYLRELATLARLARSERGTSNDSGQRQAHSTPRKTD